LQRVHQLLEKYAPLRTIRLRGPEQKVNPRVERTKKYRDCQLKKYKKIGKKKYLRKCKRATAYMKKLIKHEPK